MEMISMEQFNKLKEAMESSQDDDTPFLVATGDELNVKGNVNKTEVKPKDYVVTFAFPNTQEYRKRIEANGDKIVKTLDSYIVVDRTYKDVYVTPRNVGKSVSAFALVEQFFYKITENGEVKAFTTEEIQSLFNYINHEIGDATYEVCAAVLRIPYDEVEWILPMSAIENAVTIIANNPSVMNETDLFFGLSLARA